MLCAHYMTGRLIVLRGDLFCVLQAFLIANFRSETKIRRIIAPCSSDMARSAGENLPTSFRTNNERNIGDFCLYNFCTILYQHSPSLLQPITPSGTYMRRKVSMNTTAGFALAWTVNPPRTVTRLKYPFVTARGRPSNLVRQLE